MKIDIRKEIENLVVKIIDLVGKEEYIHLLKENNLESADLSYNEIMAGGIDAANVPEGFYINFYDGLKKIFDELEK